MSKARNKYIFNKKKIQNVSDVTAWRLCNGCGACESVCENSNISLINYADLGIRPVCKGICSDCGTCLNVCSGIKNRRYNNSDKINKDLEPYIGPALEVWEGYSTDEFLRFNCSSGGVATALALYCLEKVKNCTGVLHTKANECKPWINETVYSKNKESLLSGMGSRYSPASPCSKLSDMRKYDGSVFIGKPCDVSSLRNAQLIYNDLPSKLILSIGIFCAGTPSTQGTLDLINNNDMDLKNVKELKYRGTGWPGYFKCSDNNRNIEIPYEKSWSFLQKYRPLRCYMCADGTSETADISCGDAWYLRDENKKGVSIIILRNENGKRIFDSAVKDGYIIAKKIEIGNIIESQKSLISKQMEMWGRIAILKTFGIPAPRFKGWPLFSTWLKKTSLKEKSRSIISTAKRVITRKLYKPLEKQHFEH